MKYFWCMILLALLPSVVAQEQKLPQVAVLDLRGDQSVTPEQLAFMTGGIVQELVRSRQFAVLERGRMEFILQEQGFQHSGACTSTDCQVEIGRMLGVEFLVAGSLVRFGPSYMIRLDYIQVETGRIIASVDAQARGELHDIVQSITKSVVRSLIQELRGEKQQPTPETDGIKPEPDSVTTPAVPDPVATLDMTQQSPVHTGIPPTPRKPLSTKRTIALIFATGALGGVGGGYYLNTQVDDRYADYSVSLANWERENTVENGDRLIYDYDSMQNMELMRNSAYGGSAGLGLLALVLWFWPEASQ